MLDNIKSFHATGTTVIKGGAKFIRYALAGSALAFAAGAFSQASATPVFVYTGGIYQPGTINITGPDISMSAYSSALELTASVNGSPTVKTLYTFCVDIYHDISVGIDNNHDIVTGAGDAQSAVNLPYHTGLLTVNSDGPISGVSGAALSADQIAEIGGLANLGGDLIHTDAADLSNKLAGIQGAIWSIEYPTSGGYSISATSAAVQSYLNGYVANAAATESHTPVTAIYGANGQGLLPAGGVPEPASWALMLSGFGFAGAALRRRQQVSIAAI